MKMQNALNKISIYSFIFFTPIIRFSGDIMFKKFLIYLALILVLTALAAFIYALSYIRVKMNICTISSLYY